MAESARSGARLAPAGTVRRAAVPQLVIVRAVACLGVVLIHALSVTLTRLSPDSGLAMTLGATQMLLMFCTPTFVFLSAAVVGYAYDSPPAGFLRRRTRYVLVPFVVMGVLYAMITPLPYLAQYETFRAVFVDVLRFTARNLVGGNHLWFIIPISQFYLMYALCGRWLERAPAMIVLPSALLLNGAYLSALNFAVVNPDWQPSILAVAGRDVWTLFFPAWLFYFAYGHWLGRRLRHSTGPSAAQVLSQVAVAVVAGALVLYLHFSSRLITISSQRVDVLLYTAAIIPVLLFAAARLQNTAGLLVSISGCSFGIYILHPLFIDIGRRLLRMTPEVPVAVYPILLWAFGTSAALCATRLLGRLRSGWLFVGAAGRSPGAPGVSGLDDRRSLVQPVPFPGARAEVQRVRESTARFF